MSLVSDDVSTTVRDEVHATARRAGEASIALATATRATKDAALLAAADALVAATDRIVEASDLDVEAARAAGAMT